MSNKEKLLAIVLAETAKQADIPPASQLNALALAAKYVKFGTDLSVLETLEYPNPVIQ